MVIAPWWSAGFITKATRRSDFRPIVPETEHYSHFLP
jgi:hypothetical protein